MHRLFNENRPVIYLSLAGAFGFAIDRVLKYYASTMEVDAIPLIGDWVDFSFFMNDQMAFSLPVAVEITRLVSLVIFLIVGYLAINTFQNSKWQCGALLIVLWGAFSNLIDRFYHGFVIDYIDIIGRSMFNLADILIGVGLVLLVLIPIRKKKKQSQ